MYGVTKWKNNKPLSELSEISPVNLILDFDKTFNSKKISEDILVPQKIYDLRRAAEAHREVRKYVQTALKPGLKILDICNMIENKTRSLLGDNLKSGIGFPVSFSLNNVVAHDSASIDDKRIITKNDIVKIDFGTHVNGNIIDSAFTISFNPEHEKLIQVSRDAVYEAIKIAGPDTLINEVSEKIQEVIEAEEITLNGKTYELHSIQNLGGHDLLPYIIHGGSLILGQPNEINNGKRMKADTQYAIELFPTNGADKIVEDNSEDCKLFMLNKTITKYPFKDLTLKISHEVLNYIKSERTTLPFCSRWLFDKIGKNYKIGLNELVKKNIVIACLPLVNGVKDKNIISAQTEHSIFITDYGKEILSYGEDY